MRSVSRFLEPPWLAWAGRTSWGVFPALSTRVAVEPNLWGWCDAVVPGANESHLCNLTSEPGTALGLTQPLLALSSAFLGSLSWPTQ